MANRYWLTTCLNFSANISDLSGGEVVGAVNGLTWNPHPTDFYPYAEVLTAGDGQRTGLGYVNFKWVTPGDTTLTAEQGNYLMSFFTGDEPDVSVCVKTRTDEFVQNSLGEYEFRYRWYRARMKRPRWVPAPAFRLRNVEIEFTHAEEL